MHNDTKSETGWDNRSHEHPLQDINYSLVPMSCLPNPPMDKEFWLSSLQPRINNKIDSAFFKATNSDVHRAWFNNWLSLVFIPCMTWPLVDNRMNSCWSWEFEPDYIIDPYRSVPYMPGVRKNVLYIVDHEIHVVHTQVVRMLYQLPFPIEMTFPCASYQMSIHYHPWDWQLDDISGNDLRQCIVNVLFVEWSRRGHILVWLKRGEIAWRDKTVVFVVDPMRIKRRIMIWG